MGWAVAVGAAWGGRVRLSAEQLEEIRRLHADGRSVREIARETGVSRSSVHRALVSMSGPESSAVVEQREPDRARSELPGMLRPMTEADHAAFDRVERPRRLLW